MTEDELTAGIIPVIFGAPAREACPGFTPESGAQAKAHELVAAVNNALNGCSGTARRWAGESRHQARRPTAAATLLVDIAGQRDAGA